MWEVILNISHDKSKKQICRLFMKINRQCPIWVFNILSSFLFLLTRAKRICDFWGWHLLQRIGIQKHMSYILIHVCHTLNIAPSVITEALTLLPCQL